MATAVDDAVAIKTKGRILIVDDELVVRDSLGKWFSSEGYAAQPVGSAREALESIQHKEFDIALIDIKMPGMDGMELQARLKEADPDLAVVIMTTVRSGSASRRRDCSSMPSMPGILISISAISNSSC